MCEGHQEQDRALAATKVAAAAVEAAARVAAQAVEAAAKVASAAKEAAAFTTAAVEAAGGLSPNIERIRELSTASLSHIERIRQISENLRDTTAAVKAAGGLSPNIERIRESHIERIRQISENLHDPDLAYRILDELQDGIILVDRAGIIQLVNKQMEALFGYMRFELDGSPLSLLLPVAKRETHEQMLAKYFTNPVKRSMMDTIKHGLTLTCLHKDGTEFALDISLTPLKTPNDVFVVAVTRRK